MPDTAIAQSTITRTERGLVVAGTRITLYDIMAYVRAEWPPRLIQHWLDLSEPQMTAALDYIQMHHDEIEAEYEHVLQHAEANRQYWEARNRQRFEQIANLPPKPGYEAIYARLQARKAARDGS